MTLIQMLDERERAKSALEFIESAERVCKKTGSFSPWFMESLHTVVERSRQDYAEIDKKVKARKKAISRMISGGKSSSALEVDSYYGYP